jgi:hypothetical protein
VIAPVDAPPEAPRTRSRVGFVLATIVTVALVSMWIYVLYLAFGPGRQDSPDKIADPAFAPAAQARCDRALDRISELQPAYQSKDAAARAVVLTKANDDLAGMLEDLATLVPTGDDGHIVREWLADWHTYLHDREAYATALETDPKARLLVTAKGGTQITDYLDQFSKDNDMPACSTPGDAG